MIAEPDLSGLRATGADKPLYVMKLKELALMLDGVLKGDEDTDITGASGVHDAKKGDVTFLSDNKLLKECMQSGASCVIVNDLVPDMAKPQIIVKNPYYAFAIALERLHAVPAVPVGISQEALVSENAQLGSGVSVYPFAHISENAVIGDNTVIYPGVFVGSNSVIGSDCTIYPNVTVRENVKIGNRVIIHAGAVVGSDGFGYVPVAGKHHKVPQVGGVVIGDDVEIGANVTIDRATTGNTIIGSGTKIDNLVQVGHNVRVGEDSILVAQVGIGGSSNIGNSVVIGGQAGIADHVKIDDGCLIAAQSGIMRDLEKGVYSGSPAMPHKEHLKVMALYARLAEVFKKVKDIEKRLNEIERRPSE